jgi:hypothetical protein
VVAAQSTASRCHRQTMCDPSYSAVE